MEPGGAQFVLEAVDAAEVGAWEWRIGEGLVAADQVALALLGHPELRLPASADELRPLVHPDDLPALVAAVEQSIVTGARLSIDVRYLVGVTWTWVLVIAQPIDDDGSGRRARLLGIVTNAEALHRATQRRGQVEHERLSTVLRVTDAAMWQWDVSSSSVHFDDALASMLGYDPHALNGVTMEFLRRIGHPDDLAGAQQEMLDFVEHPDDHSMRIVVRVRHADGHWVWLELRGGVAEWAEDTGPASIVGVIMDNSAAYANEEQLRTSSTYARSLIEASLDPLVTIGIDGRIMDVNHATEVATGRSREQLVGSDFSEFFTEPEKARIGYEQVFSVGRVIDYPLTLQHSSGRTMDVLYNASTYHDADGRVAGAFAAARDVTEVRRSQHELEETNREVLLLSQMSDLLQSCQIVTEAIPIIQASMGALFPGTHGRGFLLNPSTQQLDEVIAWGGMLAEPISVSPEECWALRRSSIHEVNLEHPLNPPCRLMPGESHPYLCVPLMAQGQALGILHLIADGVTSIEGRYAHLARTTADSMSLALANIRLRENLQALSIRDPLTGLYNRRFLEDALAREISRARRAKESGVIAMIDIDHFKKFNDDFGHEAGDAVLVTVAEELRGFRESDLSCRYGGEEFLLVLPGVDHDLAVARLEQLRRAISDARTYSAGRPLPAITVSIGMTVFPKRDLDGSALIREADEALYRAKANGRDRLEVAGDQGEAVGGS